MANFDDSKIKFTSYDSVKSSPGLEPLKKQKLTLNLSNLDAAANSDTADFANQIPANSILMGVSYNVRTLATDGVVTVSSAGVTLGDGSDADRFMSSVDVLTGSGSTGFARVNPANPGGASDVYPLALASATTVRATLSLDVDVDTLTAFEMDIWIDYYSPSDPEA
jgi:hypothetical protein